MPYQKLHSGACFVRARPSGAGHQNCENAVFHGLLEQDVACTPRVYQLWHLCRSDSSDRLAFYLRHTEVGGPWEADRCLEGHKGRLFCQKTHVPCFRASRCSNPNAKAPRAQPFEFQSLHSYAPLSREEQTLLLSPCLVSCLEAFEVWTPGWSAMESEIQALLHVQGFDQGSVRFGCFGVA